MSQPPGPLRRTKDVAVRAAKHPGAKWFDSIDSAVLAGVIVVVLTTGHSGPAPSPTASASPPNPASGITLSASFVPGMYSEAKDGFAELLPDGAAITSAMKRAPDCESLHAMLAAAGGVDDGGSYVRLLFQNATSLPVTITQVKAQVEPIVASTLATRIQCTQGAGPLIPLKGDIQLDSSPAVVRAVKVDKTNEFSWKPGDPYFVEQLVQVLPGRGAVLDVQVEPGTCTCSWRVVADLTVNGRPITLVATDGTGASHVAAFRTAPFPTSPGHECWAFDFHPPHLVRSSPPC